jgi:hypothetical protein
MKTIISVCIGLLLVTSTGSILFSQTASEKTREVYLSANNIKDWSYGFQYKSSLQKENTFLRMSVMKISSDYDHLTYGISTQYPEKQFNLNFQFQGGIEKRINYEKVTLFSGIDLSTGIYHRNVRIDNPAVPPDQRNNKNNIFDVGFSFASGVIYQVSDLVGIGAEFIPGFYYSYSSSEHYSGNQQIKNTYWGPSISFDPASIQFSLIVKLVTSR